MTFPPASKQSTIRSAIALTLSTRPGSPCGVRRTSEARKTCAGPPLSNVSWALTTLSPKIANDAVSSLTQIFRTCAAAECCPRKAERVSTSTSMLNAQPLTCRDDRYGENCRPCPRVTTRSCVALSHELSRVRRMALEVDWAVHVPSSGSRRHVPAQARNGMLEAASAPRHANWLSRRSTTAPCHPTWTPDDGGCHGSGAVQVCSALE
jgi:hypothetical protein